MNVVTLLHPDSAAGTTRLVESIRAVDPAVVVHGLPLTPGMAAPDGITPIPPAQLGTDELSYLELAAAAPPDELVGLAVPLALRHVANRADGPVVLLGHHVEVIGPLDALLAGAPDTPLVFAERCRPPSVADGRRPDLVDLAVVGIVSPNIVVVRDGADALLDRWATLAVDAWRRGAPLSLDVVAALLTDDPGCARGQLPALLDMWAVGARSIVAGGSGDADLRAGDHRLAVVDFDGHERTAPHRALGGDGPARGRLSEQPALAPLLARRDHALAEAPAVTAASPLIAGVRLDPFMRARYSRALRGSLAGEGERPPSPYAEGAGFLEWLRGSDVGGPVPVSRYVDEIRASRPDLVAAFPAVPGRDAAGLLRWVLEHGRDEHAVPPELLPDPPPPHPTPPARLPPGVNLAGFLSAELGVGEVARRIAASLDAVAMPHSTRTFSRTTSRQAVDAPPDTAPAFDTNIVCVNADSSGAFAQTVGPAFAAGRYRIGVWFWETPDLPGFFHPAFGDVDELWAASDYVVDALRAAAPADVPVTRFPLPIVVPPTDPTFARTSLDLPEQRPLIVCSFDHLSVPDRKNPFGVVDAFRAAFAPDEGPVLLVKSINGDKRPDDLDRLRWHANGRADVILRDGYLDARQNAALLALADCYVSLHRSEGFGFNLADAMALGTPVVATGHSGNLAFMREDDSLLVRYALTPVGDGRFPYLPTSLWADPDLDHAAALLRSVVDDPGVARARAELARTRVLRDFSLEATGEFVARRLAEIRSARNGDGGRARSAATIAALRRTLRAVAARLPHSGMRVRR